MDYRADTRLYYGLLYTKGKRISYSMYMKSSYINELKSKMYAERQSCHFCKNCFPEHLLYPFLFRIKPYQQIIFSNVVLACDPCRYKHLKEYIKF